MMRASTLLLVTWLIWITAKKRLGAYWQLATTSAAPSTTGAGAPGSDASHAATLPGISVNGNPLPVLPPLQ